MYYKTLVALRGDQLTGALTLRAARSVKSAQEKKNAQRAAPRTPPRALPDPSQLYLPRLGK